MVDPQARVCPECGAPAVVAAFCAQCGLNLSTIERLPTREEWERSAAESADPVAAAVVERLKQIEPLPVSLFDILASERTTTNQKVVKVVADALTRAVERLVPMEHRGSHNGTLVRAEYEDSGTTVTVRLPSGNAIRQRFVFEIRGPRATAKRQGDPLIAVGSGPFRVPATPTAPPSAPAQERAVPRQPAVTAPSPRSRSTDPSVLVAGFVALAAALLIVIGSFLHVHTLGLLTGSVPSNSFVADGYWWVLVLGCVAGVGALNALLGVPKNSIVPILVAGAGGVVAGIIGLSTSFQRLSINPEYRSVVGMNSVHAGTGVGVYLVLAGGGVALAAALMLLAARTE